MWDPTRRGAGPRPLARSSVRIFVAETLMPSLASSPRIRMHPHLGFFLPNRRMSSRTSAAIGGLPPTDPRLKLHFRRTRSRCHRRSVWGLTRNDDQRPRGRALLNAVMNSRSRRRRRGMPTWRLRTISWWRSTTSSTSRSRSPEEPTTSRTRRHSNKYANAKSTDGTSRETEARWYESPLLEATISGFCTLQGPPAETYAVLITALMRKCAEPGS
jgi:hypothetical protein